MEEKIDYYLQKIHSLHVMGEVAESLAMLKCWIGLNRQDEYGQTPLHYLCHNQNISLEVLKYLTENWWLDVNIKNFNDETLLHKLCENPKISPELLKYSIQQRGAKVNATDKYGKAPLHYLCENLNVSCELLECLIA